MLPVFNDWQKLMRRENRDAPDSVGTAILVGGVLWFYVASEIHTTLAPCLQRYTSSLIEASDIL